MTKKEQAKLQINFSKIGADEQKYFDLFDKHIPENVQGNVLIYDISNLGCIYKILQKNPEAKYFIYDNESVNKGLKLMISEFNVKFLDEDPLYNINNNMKFDLIIMNPPYDGLKNLYGKLTLEAKKHANKVVCLSPYLNYITDKKSFNKVSDELNKYFEDFELCDNTLFDAAFDKQLCVFTFGQNKIKDFNDLFWVKFSNAKLAKSIIEKIKTKSDFCNKHTINYNSFNKFKYKCVMTFVRGNFDIQNKTPSWDWTTLFSEKFQTKFDWKQSDIKTPHCQAIPFDSEIECKHFCDYCNSDIIAFIIYAYKGSLSQSSNLQYIPYMPTYKTEWTDQAIAAEFGLTDVELNYIYGEMKTYGWKTKR